MTSTAAASQSCVDAWIDPELSAAIRARVERPAAPASSSLSLNNQLSAAVESDAT